MLSPFGITTEECFTIPVDLDKGGYLAVTGSAGMMHFDYHEIMSIRVMDPMLEDNNRLLDEKHKKKAEKVKYTKSKDVIHSSKV